MDSQKQQLAERIKQANNILVTVSSNPSVDQLAACIGLTISLNKMGKHATAVFSGAVPSTLEFLQPEKTIEKNTDSLRDFIISLDKSKADKLRYKVEDKVVKIFITPYRTSISDRDLEFSQGDFNVDVVVALGVHQQADLDQAITSHGRILHDATVAAINVQPGGDLGTLNWLDPGASSLSELAVSLVEELDKSLLDNQISTAFLTGIVAETERFSNAKTSPRTMSISAELMAAGANQQLVATKLEEPVQVPEPAPAPPSDDDQPALPESPKDKVADDGTLEISHDSSDEPDQSDQQEAAPQDQPADQPDQPQPEKQDQEPEEPQPQKSADEARHYHKEPPADNKPAGDDAHEGKGKHHADPDEPYIKEKHELRIEPPRHEDEQPQPSAGSQPTKEEAPAQPDQPDKQPELELPALPPVSVSAPAEPQLEPYQPIAPEIHIDESGALHLPAKDTGPAPTISHHNEPPKMVTPPPAAASTQLTANTEPEKLSPSTDPLTLPPVDGPLLSRDYGSSEPLGSTILPPSEGVTPASDATVPASGPAGQPAGAMPPLDLPTPSFQPSPLPEPHLSAAMPTPDPLAIPSSTPPAGTTLSELEQQVHSTHAQPPAAAQASGQPAGQDAATTQSAKNNDAKSDDLSAELEKARNAVENAISAGGIEPLQPIQALNAQPLPLNSQPAPEPTGQPLNPVAPPTPQPVQFGQPQAQPPAFTMPQPSIQQPQQVGTTPPPVPPPMMPPMPPYQQ